MIVVHGGEMFFDTYYSRSRFAVETLLATIAVSSNALMLLLTRGNRHRRHYSYFALFRNLLVANVLSSLAQWFTNNLLYLFNKQLPPVEDYCNLMMVLLTANVISRVFGWVSVVSLLGLSIMHCLAVCYPIAYVVQMSTARIHFAIAMSWVVTSAIASAEILVIAGHLTIGSHGNCSSQINFIDTISLVDTDVTMATLTLMYTVIIGLCVRIALEIRRLQRRLNRLCWTDTLQQERGTFRSIVGLTITMIVFVFPYHLLYFLSMNFDLRTTIDGSLLLYFMNFLPYVKFATDPVFFCRKRIVKWRNVGCIFSVLVCRKMATSDTSREDRGLMEDNNFSAVTVAPVPEETIGYISGSVRTDSTHICKSSTNNTSDGPQGPQIQTTGFLPCTNTSLV